MRRLLVGSLTMTFLFVGAVAPSIAAASISRTYGLKTPQSEATAEKEVKWTSNVATSLGKGSWTFTSNGLPASNFVATHYAVPSDPLDVSANGASVVASSSVLKDQNYDYTLPLTPVYSKKVTTTNQGPIGFLLDGGALYNPYEANHATVATSDNFVTTVNGVSASFLDSCDGHPGPGGKYHYHGLPSCLVSYATGASPTVTSVSSTTGTSTSAVHKTDAASKKPVILGFAFDGYGIYDNIAMNGSAIPVSSLDACNGIFSPVPGYSHGVYHYVLENVKGARSSIGCYHGVVSSAYTQALQGILNDGNAPQPSTSSLSVSVPATAFTLAANKNEVELLKAMLKSSDVIHDC
ncbi:MAG TPA: YHYH protein [Acidimicrobiales bacterium]